jgi:hypothetical protein
VAETPFLIGVGVASRVILVKVSQRCRVGVVEPIVGVVSDGLSAHVVRPIMASAEDGGDLAATHAMCGGG